MVEVAGIDHVGIGAGFDGGGGVKGCNGDNDFINITVRLLEHGFTETDKRCIRDSGNPVQAFAGAIQRDRPGGSAREYALFLVCHHAGMRGIWGEYAFSYTHLLSESSDMAKS